MVALAAYLLIGWILAIIFGPIVEALDFGDGLSAAMGFALVFAWPVVLPIGAILAVIGGIMSLVQRSARAARRSVAAAIPAPYRGAVARAGRLTLRSVRVAALALYGSVAVLLLCSALWSVVTSRW